MTSQYAYKNIYISNILTYKFRHEKDASFGQNHENTDNLKVRAKCIIVFQEYNVILREDNYIYNIGLDVPRKTITFYTL